MNAVYAVETQILNRI